MTENHDYLEFIKSKLGDETLNIFRKHNLTMDLLQVLPIDKLVDLGIDKTVAEQIKTQIDEQRINKVTTGLDLMRLNHPSKSLTTGIDSLDEILRGIRRSTYEVFGESNVCKTQLCHQLSVTVQLPFENGGFDKKAIYIDNIKL